ncbi:hypothetical protein GYM41_004039, partial [Escherichia coli]|nr:hypothetical protein [Escherichia coli]
AQVRTQGRIRHADCRQRKLADFLCTGGIIQGRIRRTHRIRPGNSALLNESLYCFTFNLLKIPPAIKTVKIVVSLFFAKREFIHQRSEHFINLFTLNRFYCGAFSLNLIKDCHEITKNPFNDFQPIFRFFC